MGHRREQRGVEGFSRNPRCLRFKLSLAKHPLAGPPEHPQPRDEPVPLTGVTVSVLVRAGSRGYLLYRKLARYDHLPSISTYAMLAVSFYNRSSIVRPGNEENAAVKGGSPCGSSAGRSGSLECKSGRDKKAKNRV